MTDQLEDQTQGGSTVDRSLPGGCMADSDLPTKGRQRGVRAVELNVAARLENLALLRTLVGAIGTFEDLDFDAVADLRLAVDEVCTRLIRSALPDATLRLVVDPRKDEVVVEASAACDTHDVVAPGSFTCPDRAGRRRPDLPRRSPARCSRQCLRHHVDRPTGGIQQVTARAAGGSASRANEYADVPEMFRELVGLPAGSPEFQRHRDKIVQRCLPLADHIARRFEGRGEPRDDLIQVARVGLVNAAVRFDVKTGSDFVSFAVPTIMGEVRRHFRDNSWSVKVPRRLKELHLRLGTATADLSQRLGRAPSASELAAELGMDRAEVIEGLLAGSSYHTLSIDSGGGSDDDARAITDTLGDVDAGLDQIENREVLRPLLEALPERERTVLVLRFFDSMTQTQIAERVGISQMHVSRLLAKSLARLRDQLE